MFEKASRLKLRFYTPVGNLTVEDLWDLPLSASQGRASLDDLAKQLNKAVKESGEESFVIQKSTEDEILLLKFEIVKHVIKVKLQEAKDNENAAIKRAQKDKIMAIIADKDDAELHGKSKEELVALMKNL